MNELDYTREEYVVCTKVDGRLVGGGWVCQTEAEARAFAKPDTNPRVETVIYKKVTTVTYEEV